VVLGVTGFSCGALTQSERAQIDTWLTCQECSTALLDSVVVLASHKPGATRDTLALDVLRGPSLDRRANFSAQLDTTYTLLTSGGDTLPVTRPVYVRHYLNNLVAGYQVRAGVALATAYSGDSTALRVLDSVYADTALRGDVRDAILFARDSIWSP
jgi:hypothetical protein